MNGHTVYIHPFALYSGFAPYIGFTPGAPVFTHFISARRRYFFICICIKGPAVVVIASFFSTIALLIPPMLPLLVSWVVLMPVHIKTGNLDISPSKEISPLLIMSKEETIKTNRNHFCYKHPVSWVCSYSEDLFLQAAP